MFRVLCVLLCVCAIRAQVIPGKSRTNDGDYNSVNTDGSFDFGYSNKDIGSSYHLARGNAQKVVGGRFGARDPATGTVKETVYTAGPRGFRAKGPNVHRKMDLDQRPRGPIGNKDDPYFDPNEDPSYDFKFNTRTYSKTENADSRGDVKGHYTYLDDIGERHDVSYIAGKDTGFHVSSAHPDSPNTIGSLFHRAPLVRGETKQRGRTAIQRGLDGSYRFISAGPDQRRTESSDSNGNVRGSYTFLDDKGVQRTVNYIAGPGIGYRIVKNGKDPYIPSAYDPDFLSVASPKYSPDDVGADVFKGPDGTAASGHVKPPPFSTTADKERSGKKPTTPTKTEDNDYNQGSSGYDENEVLGPSSLSSDEDVSNFEAKPTKLPGRRPPSRRPTPKPYIPPRKTYVPIKPFQKQPLDESIYSGTSPIDESLYSGTFGDKTPKTNGPEFAVGFDINHKDGSDSFKGPISKLGPGTTIIRNIGQDYFGIPPGVSVRAHVQSIDLYPYESKPMSPSEALERDKT